MLRAGLVLLIFGSGCRGVSTPVERIIREPERYHAQKVTVEGTVESVRWSPQAGAFAFTLRQGRDSLLVLTLGDPPEEGSNRRLHGRISRRLPFEGVSRTVLYYRIDPGGLEQTDQVDTR